MSLIEKLDGVLALAEKATPGQWQSKNEREWDEIIGNIDGPDDGHFYYTHICSVDMLDLQTPEQRANAKLIAATINLLRDHGPAIRQAMIDAERYAWLRKFSDNGGAVKPMVPTLTWAGPYTEGWHGNLDAAIDKARATGEGEGHD